MANAPSSIKKEHLREHFIKQQGKDYIQYAGLIAEFHRVCDAEAAANRSEYGIRTTLIQVPSAENNQTAIVTADVTMPDGAYFYGIGDANPGNVNKMLAGAIIRMAETRAKGRALRDALNIGVTMYEELPDAASTSDLDEGEPEPKAEPKTGAKTKKGDAIDRETLYKTICTKITAYSEATGTNAAEVVTSLKDGAGVTAALLGEATDAQLQQVDKTLSAALAKVTAAA